MVGVFVRFFSTGRCKCLYLLGIVDDKHMGEVFILHTCALRRVDVGRIFVNIILPLHLLAPSTLYGERGHALVFSLCTIDGTHVHMFGVDGESKVAVEGIYGLVFSGEQTNLLAVAVAVREQSLDGTLQVRRCRGEGLAVGLHAALLLVGHPQQVEVAHLCRHEHLVLVFIHADVDIRLLVRGVGVVADALDALVVGRAAQSGIGVRHILVFADGQQVVAKDFIGYCIIDTATLVMVAIIIVNCLRLTRSAILVISILVAVLLQIGPSVVHQVVDTSYHPVGTHVVAVAACNGRGLDEIGSTRHLVLRADDDVVGLITCIIFQRFPCVGDVGVRFVFLTAQIHHIRGQHLGGQSLALFVGTEPEGFGISIVCRGVGRVVLLVVHHHLACGCLLVILRHVAPEHGVHYLRGVVGFEGSFCCSGHITSLVGVEQIDSGIGHSLVFHHIAVEHVERGKVTHRHGASPAHCLV